jgi:hypothetical protein
MNTCAPARLTTDMNALLDTTDTAFGRAVQALHFRRRTLSARRNVTTLPLKRMTRYDRHLSRLICVSSLATNMTHLLALNFEDGVTQFVHCHEGDTVAKAAYRSNIDIPACGVGASQMRPQMDRVIDIAASSHACKTGASRFAAVIRVLQRLSPTTSALSLELSRQRCDERSCDRCPRSESSARGRGGCLCCRSGGNGRSDTAVAAG